MSYKIESTIKWNGLDAIRLFDNAQLKALTESASIVENKAVETVHVGKSRPGYVGGTLRQSITRDIKNDTAYVGTNIEYAPYEEFGTRFRPAHPYLRPAFKSSITQIKNIFKKYFKAVKYVD